MSTIFVDNVKTVSGTETMKDGLFSHLSTTKPSNPATGVVFLDSTTKILSIYDGSNWRIISGPSGGQISS